MPNACFIYYMVFNNSALLYREAKTLKEAGYHVDIIALRDSKKEPLFQAFEGLNLYTIQTRSCAEKKIVHYFLKLALFIFKATFLVTILGVFKRYKIIHVTSPPDLLVFITIIPKILGGKIILDIHDINPEFFMRKLHIEESKPIIKLLKFIEKIAANFSDHVLIVTDLWREKLIVRSVADNKCSVLLNVPDENLFGTLNRKVSRSKNNFQMYYHGSLEEHFGVDTLIQAMPKIIEAIPKVKLHIYGDGRLRVQFEKTAKTLKLDGAINFCHRVPFYQLPNVLKNADVGIVPTKGAVFSEDTVSMKSMEYISLGIPIVISRTRAHKFYYDESMVNFFEPENENELAEAVISLFHNKNLREQLIQNSQQFIRKHGWQCSKQIYLNIVEKLIADHKTPADIASYQSPIVILAEKSISNILTNTIYSESYGRVTILAYHHVSSETDHDRLQIDSVRLTDFEEQLKFLQANSFNICSLEKLVFDLQAGKKLRPKTVIITIDDGYRSVYMNVLPVLKKYEVPATVFIVPKFIGDSKPFPWLRELNNKIIPTDLLPLNWKQIEELLSNGIEIGSHSFSHKFLPMLDGSALEKELLESRTLIAEKVGQFPKSLALPFSFPLNHLSWRGFQSRLMNAITEAKYTSCCTLLRGYISSKSNPLLLKRILIGKYDDLRSFNTKLIGAYGWTSFPQMIFQKMLKNYDAAI